MKTDSLLFIRSALYDLVYLLDFRSEEGADFYTKEIKKILNKIYKEQGLDAKVDAFAEA